MKINILHFPSWYPSTKHPYAGIFTKEFIYSFAKSYNKINHFVLNNIENEFNLSLRNINSIKLIAKYFKTKSETKEKKIFDNLEEIILQKHIEYSKIFGFDFFKQFLKLNEKTIDEIIISKNINCIHIHVCDTIAIVGKYFADKHKIQYIITEHMNPFPFPKLLNKNNSLYPNVQSIIDNANILVSVSNAQKNQIIRYTNNNIKVIPNIIDSNFFHPSRQLVNNKFTFLTVTSSLSKIKGIDQLLHAISKIKDINAEFHIGGSEVDIDFYKKLAESLNIEHKIKWFGKISREEVRDKMQECDCFILASQMESFGVVYAEAIACGKPVIATKCGGPEDIVTDINGKLVTVDDILELSETIMYMFQNINKYNTIDIRNDFEKRFSNSKIFIDYIEIYNNILN